MLKMAHLIIYTSHACMSIVNAHVEKFVHADITILTFLSEELLCSCVL